MKGILAKEQKWILYILPLLLMGIIYIIKSYFFLPHDFANYYFGAYFLENGSFSKIIYDPTWFNQKIFEIQKNVFASYSPNTPFLALFFVPFTLFSFSTAKIVFNSLSLILFLYTLKNIFTTYKISNIHYVTVFLVFLIPIKNNILFGQVYLLLFFLISEGFLAYKQEKKLKMGILWSIAILLKVFPLILFGFLLFQKKIKSFLVLAFCTAIILTISISVNGFDAWLYFIENILPKANKGEISGEFIKGYQSILMFLKHVFIHNEIKNPDAIIHSPSIYYLLLIVSKLLIIGYGLLITWNQKSKLLRFSYWILASYLLSPYGSSYSNILLIILLIQLLRENSKDYLVLFGVAILFLICNFPFHYTYNLPLPFSFLKLFLYLSLWCLIFFKKINLAKWHLSILSISLCVSAIFLWNNDEKKINPDTNYLLEKDQHQALIYDYYVENEVLMYKYWAEEGSQTKSTDINVKSINYEISIKNNQIYHGATKITDDPSNKYKPAIINEDTLIYLSDTQRGYGFYTFRKIILTKNKY
ncbi:glycosyltransferase family 87 protein [uncultured Aquimarina sp.]|uniref:glycosyltransferase family 87 protein n=1 Tax=uncultured Aquimarina sp. TaxID=575652 RepID=UPI00262D3CCC|nr:glycosyltransferase family 87 protein [uncultured Aquimarina sp.]